MNAERRSGWLAGDAEILRDLSAGDWLTIAAVTLGCAAVTSVFLTPIAAVAATILGALAVTVAATDARLLLVPDVLSLALFTTGLAAATAIAAFQPDPFGLTDPWPTALALGLAGSAVGAAVLAALRWVWIKARSVEAMGFGDIKLAAGLGAWLGPIDIFTAFAVAAVAGLALVAVARILGRAGPRSVTESNRLPFAALLAPAAWVVFVLMRL